MLQFDIQKGVAPTSIGIILNTRRFMALYGNMGHLLENDENDIRPGSAESSPTVTSTPTKTGSPKSPTTPDTSAASINLDAAASSMKGRVHLGGNIFAVLNKDTTVTIRYCREEAEIAHEMWTRKHFVPSPSNSSPPLSFINEDTMCVEEEHLHKRRMRRAQEKEEERNRRITTYTVNDCQEITLTRLQLQKIKDIYPEIVARCKELAEVYPCMLDHNNQMSFYQCRECCPFPITCNYYDSLPFWEYSWSETDKFPLQTALATESRIADAPEIEREIEVEHL